jgi:lipopolysaccharide export system permease protein
MRGSRTLTRSLAGEIAQYTLVGFAAASVVLLSQNLLRRMEDFTAVGFTGAEFAVVLRCLLPMLTAYSIPVALLFGVALAVRRWVSDSEVLAMRACGLGVRTLLLPAVAIGISVSAASAWLLLGVEHEARRDLIRLFNTVAARGGILQSGDFRGINDRVIYVAQRHRDDRLEGVMISDRTQEPPFMIFAEEGRLSLDPESTLLHLKLGKGELHIGEDDPASERYRRVLFRSFDYSLNVASLLSENARPVRPKQMTLSELSDVVARGRSGDPLHDLKKKEPVLYELEMHRRFALPAAPLLFAIAAVPIALAGERRSRAWPIIACAGVAFAFYAFLMLLQTLALDAGLPPVIASWLPNALLLAGSLVGLRRIDAGESI